MKRGDTLGPYRVLDSLGVGGMGAVYKARDARLGRTVAIEVVNAEFTQRFEREARAIALSADSLIFSRATLGGAYPHWLRIPQTQERPTYASAKSCSFCRAGSRR